MELLVVIAIIGILATVASYSLSQVKARARDASRVADVDTFVKGLDLLLNETGNYPIVGTEICIDGTDVVSLELEAAGVMSKGIKDPVFVGPPQCIRYTSDAGGTSFVIRYWLETNSIADKGYNFIP